MSGRSGSGSEKILVLSEVVVDFGWFMARLVFVHQKSTSTLPKDRDGSLKDIEKAIVFIW